MATDQDPPIDPTDPIALAQEAVRLEEENILELTVAAVQLKQLFDRTCSGTPGRGRSIGI